MIDKHKANTKKKGHYGHIESQLMCNNAIDLDSPTTCQLKTFTKHST